MINLLIIFTMNQFIIKSIGCQEIIVKKLIRFFETQIASLLQSVVKNKQTLHLVPEMISNKSCHFRSFLTCLIILFKSLNKFIILKHLFNYQNSCWLILNHSVNQLIPMKMFCCLPISNFQNCLLSILAVLFNCDKIILKWALLHCED